MFSRAALLSVFLLFVATACSGGVKPVTTSPAGTNPSQSSIEPTSAPSPDRSPVAISELSAQSVSFISANEGWLLAGYPCNDQVCGSVLKTGDRAKTWSKVSDIAPTLGSNPGQVGDVRFADAKNGYLFGPELLATHDGGATWTQIELDGPVVGLAPGKNRTYALVSPCYQSADTNCTRLPELVTAAHGSDDWEPVAGFAFRPGATQPELAVSGDAVFVLEDTTPPVLFGSADGQRFARLNLPCSGDEAEPATPVALAATGPKDVVVLCQGGPAAGSAGKQVFVSSDGGLNYRKMADPPRGGIASELAAASPQVIAVTAASGATYLYRTAGGSTWTTALEFGDGGAGLRSPGFVDPTHGAVVYGPAATSLGLGEAGTGILYLSDDGGAKWRAISLAG